MVRKYLDTVSQNYLKLFYLQVLLFHGGRGGEGEISGGIHQLWLGAGELGHDRLGCLRYSRLLSGLPGGHCGGKDQTKSWIPRNLTE